jgi:hypothetical protein
MVLNNPYPHEGFVPAYQISAMPFVTSSNVTLGSIKEINFNGVTRFITIKNTSVSTSVLAVAFTENGLKTANSNYFILSGSEVFSGELRTDRIFVSGSSGATITFNIVAGLTTIPTKNFLLVTGSNGFGGVG